MFRARFWKHLCFSLLISAALLFVQTATDDTNHHPLMADEMLFLEIGHLMNKHGVFTNGVYERRKGAAEDRPGDLIAPATPALVAAVGAVYPAFQNAENCIRTGSKSKTEQPCWDTLKPGIYTKAIVVLITHGFLFAISFVAFGGQVLPAYLAPSLYFLCDDYSYFLQYFMTENLSLLFLAMGFFFLILTVKRNRYSNGRFGPEVLIAGLSLGLACLNKPSHLYLLIPLAILMPFLMTFKKAAWTSLALCLATFLTVLPWMLRNEFVTGNFDITGSYDGLILNQRLYYNSISISDWFAGLVYHIPDFGDKWAKNWFSPETIAVWDMADLNGLFWRSQKALVAGADGYPVTHLLIKDHLIPNFGKHLWTSLIISYKGLFIGDYFTLIGLPVALVGCLRLAKQGMLWLVLLIGVPMLFQIGFHGFVTVGVARYNMLIIPFVCLFVGWQIAQWLQALNDTLVSKK